MRDDNDIPARKPVTIQVSMHVGDSVVHSRVPLGQPQFQDAIGRDPMQECIDDSVAIFRYSFVCPDPHPGGDDHEEGDGETNPLTQRELSKLVSGNLIFAISSVQTMSHDNIIWSVFPLFSSCYAYLQLLSFLIFTYMTIRNSRRK